MQTRRPVAKPPTEPYRVDKDLFRDEVAKATLRIGNKEEQLAAWFLRFAQANLEQLSYGQWTDLQYEVSCLSQIQWVGLGAWQLSQVEHDWEGNRLAAPVNEDKENAWMFYQENVREELRNSLVPLHPALPPRHVIKTLQDETKNKLEDVWGSFRSKRTVPFEIPSLRGRFAVLPQDDDTIVFGFAPDPQTVFLCNFLGVLLRTAVRLRHCRECNVWFYADRSNKYYCSSRCQSRAGTRRNPPKPKTPQLSKHSAETVTPPPAVSGDATKETPRTAAVKGVPVLQSLSRKYVAPSNRQADEPLQRVDWHTNIESN